MQKFYCLGLEVRILRWLVILYIASQYYRKNWLEYTFFVLNAQFWSKCLFKKDLKTAKSSQALAKGMIGCRKLQLVIQNLHPVIDRWPTLISSADCLK